jgi:uncharacterized protein
MSFFSYSDADSRETVSGLDLSAIMRQVYLWVALGLFISFGIGFIASNWLNTSFNALTTTRAMRDFFNTIQTVSIVSMFGTIGLVIAFQATMRRARPAVSSVLYLVVTALFGVSLSIIFFAYTQNGAANAIPTAFGVTALTFTAMSVYGYTTKADLSGLRNYLIMGIIGLLIASIVNIFLQSNVIYWLVSYAGVLIYTVLTAYDTQWIKNNAASLATTGDADSIQRLAIFGAFHLFLDFINLFLFLLRIMGGGRSRN